ncbi:MULTISPECIES: lysozyme inhibitor LprI family protein [Rhodomicrobium]|uniref:lysozyme inhibitor LprI family protein n=1 Tax=Rhodomicrobium TaxID=1068 RepID=UPI001AEC83D5|nr:MULTISPECIES: lysozyme inhibitor LprI family protein [Rhodomicrobium]
MLAALIFMLSCAVSCAAAWAQDCGSAPTQAAMNRCFASAYKKNDARLNALYNEIKGRLKNKADSGPLVASQRAWLAFRDAECRFSASATAGGSVQPAILASCLDGMTRDRIKTFEAYLRCEEGDLSCPVPRAP